MNEKTPATRLKQLIERKHIQKKEFARMCGCTPSTLSKIFSETYPISSKLLERFSDILGVSKEYIMCQTDELMADNSLQFYTETGQLQTVNSTLDFLSSLGIYVREKVQIGTAIYVRGMDGFYTEDNIEEHITEQDLCYMILTSKETVSHYYIIQSNTTCRFENNVSYRQLTADEFYNFIGNLINIVYASLSPYTVNKTMMYTGNLIDKAIRKEEIYN